MARAFYFFHALHSVVENTEEMAAGPSPRTGKKKKGRGRSWSGVGLGAGGVASAFWRAQKPER